MLFFRLHCMNTSQSETARKYKEDAAKRLDALEKIMLVDWTPDEGVGGSHFEHRWLLKFILTRNTSMLTGLINRQARSYAALDKMEQLKREHPEDEDKINQMANQLQKEIALMQATIEEQQKDVVTLRIDLMKYDEAIKKQ